MDWGSWCAGLGAVVDASLPSWSPIRTPTTHPQAGHPVMANVRPTLADGLAVPQVLISARAVWCTFAPFWPPSSLTSRRVCRSARMRLWSRGSTSMRSCVWMRRTSPLQSSGAVLPY